LLFTFLEKDLKLFLQPIDYSRKSLAFSEYIFTLQATTGIQLFVFWLLKEYPFSKKEKES